MRSKSLIGGILLAMHATALPSPAGAIWSLGRSLKEACDLKNTAPVSLFAVGVIDTFEYAIADNMLFRIPPGVNVGQIGSVVCKYLDDNPQDLHLPSVMIVLDALSKAWPAGKAPR